MPCGRRELKFIQKDIPVLVPDKSIKKQNHIVEVWGIFFFFQGTSHSSSTHVKLNPFPAKHTWEQEKT